MPRVRIFLVCYDIANPKRLGKVHRYMKKRGMPLQYSVFLVQGVGDFLTQLLDDLAAIINLKEDDVRAYPINSLPEYTALGKQQLPQGLMLFGTGRLDLTEYVNMNNYP